MTALTLNIGNVLELTWQGGPIAVGYHRRENPAELLGYIIEAAVNRIRIGIVPDDMAGNAVLVEGRRADSVNSSATVSAAITVSR